jgi:hypothetical protein
MNTHTQIMRFTALLFSVLAIGVTNANDEVPGFLRSSERRLQILNTCPKQKDCFKFTVTPIESGCAIGCEYKVCAIFSATAEASCKATVSHICVPSSAGYDNCFGGGTTKDDDTTNQSQYCVTAGGNVLVPIVIKDGAECFGTDTENAEGTGELFSCKVNNGPTVVSAFVLAYFLSCHTVDTTA